MTLRKLELIATRSPTLMDVVAQIDAAIAEATRRHRHRTDAALSAMEGQCSTCAGLVDERNREPGLASLKAHRFGSLEINNQSELGWKLSAV
jgi:hypothetical protein